MGRYQKGKTSLDFTEARERVVMPSAGLYASLHLAPDTPLLSFFTGRTPFLPPNQQHQSTEGFRDFKQ